VRAHGNLTEWAPIGLILLAIFEINGGPIWLSIPMGVAFVAGRVMHPKGITSTEETEFAKRRLGMQLTIYSIMAMAALNILWMMFRFIVG